MIGRYDYTIQQALALHELFDTAFERDESVDGIATSYPIAVRELIAMGMVERGTTGYTLTSAGLYAWEDAFRQHSLKWGPRSL